MKKGFLGYMTHYRKENFIQKFNKLSALEFGRFLHQRYKRAKPFLFLATIKYQIRLKDNDTLKVRFIPEKQIKIWFVTMAHKYDQLEFDEFELIHLQTK